MGSHYKNDFVIELILNKWLTVLKVKLLTYSNLIVKEYKNYVF
jgi:hypothetical protein